MFHRLSALLDPPARSNPGLRQALKRALLFGAGLALLWVAAQLMPHRRSSPALEPLPNPAPEVDAGNERYASTRLFTPGYAVVLVLLALGSGAAYVLRRRSRGTAGPHAPIQMLGQLSLGPNQQLRLVRCGGEVLLLGVSSGQITLLREYAPEALEQDPADTGTRPAPLPAGSRQAVPARPAPHFGELLRQYAGSFVNARQTETPC